MLELPLCAEVLELAHCISRIFRRIIPAEVLDVAHNAEVLDVAHDAEVLDVPHSAEVLALSLPCVDIRTQPISFLDKIVKNHFFLRENFFVV